jgi:hypothetical protein
MEGKAVMEPAPLNDGADDESGTSLFGSLLTVITDAMSESLKAHIVQGVQTLPMMSTQPEKSKTLVEKLELQFQRAVDLVELYIGRNSFSLAMFPAESRRRAIRAAFRQEQAAPGSFLQEMPCCDGEVATDDFQVAALECPPLDQIPTDEEVQALEAETQALRQKLHALRTKRDRIKREVQHLDEANRLASLARVPLQSIDAAKVSVPLQVQATVTAVAALEQLQNTALELRLDMDERARRRDPQLDQIVELPQNKPPTTHNKRSRIGDENDTSTALVRTAAALSGIQKFTAMLDS